jgi:hypothetical protein
MLFPIKGPESARILQSEIFQQPKNLMTFNESSLHSSYFIGTLLPVSSLLHKYTYTIKKAPFPTNRASHCAPSIPFAVYSIPFFPIRDSTTANKNGP